MRIVLNTFGSFGDIHPYMAIAMELKRRGHAPVIATMEVYREKVEGIGVEFVSVRPHIAQPKEQDPELIEKIMEPKTGPRFLTEEVVFPAVRESYADLLPAVAGADLLVTHPAAPAGPLVGRKTGMPWISTVLAPLSFFSAGRPHASSAFGDRDRRILAAVTPHLVQAIRIQSRLEGIQSSRHAFSCAIERLPLAVIFLDRRCRVLEMNSTARKIVDAGDGLKLERGVLVALDTRAEVQLQQMIFGAAAMETGRFLQHGGALSLPRPEGRHPLSAMVAPTGVTGLFPGSRSARVVVLIEEPERKSQVPFAAFSRTYGLSPAETGLTARLVGGMSLRQAAAALGIRDNTARSHLKHVFAKTGAQRQSDLVRRVLTYGHSPEDGAALKDE